MESANSQNESSCQSNIAELAGQSIPNEQGQSIPIEQGQSIPTISGQSMPDGILQAMLHQQTLLLKTVQALQQKTINDKNDCVSDGESGNESTQVRTSSNAPASYELDDVSSEEEKSDTSDCEDLRSMNKLYNESDNVTDEIHEKLASNINLSLRKRLSKKDQKEVLENFHRPANVVNMRFPKVNIELWEDAHQNLRNKDMNLSKTQGLILTACSSVVEIAQKCLTKQKKEIKTKECTNALVCLSAAFTEITQIRRENFKSGMHQEFKSRLCSTDNEPSTKWIFGDELGKKIKEINDTKAVSLKLTIRSERGSFNKHRSHPYSNSKKGKQPMYKKPFLGKRRFQKSKYKTEENGWK
ncbi:uncharacterized protein LOC132722295 [Ruditapes philippinarum]|uniref:uncharacterized protein LOC132722295 n=1 Tax=Ruditapes philippinarum TaxID=129788 RepID=UPI00295B851A|nr:uncharacterized protein LOC132722295 [Ruditapes philippinarum]